MTDKTQSPWWQQGAPVDPMGLDGAVATIEQRLGDDGTLRKALSIVLGFLQQQRANPLIETTRLDEPMEFAARRDAYERGVICGIEEAGLVVDFDQLREVRTWLKETAEKESVGNA